MADLGVLSQIPGLAGYLQQTAMNQGQSAQNLQQVTGVLSLQQHIQQQQQDAQLRGILANSGGDLNKAMKASIEGGHIDWANKLAPLIKIQQDNDFQKSLSGMITGGSLNADQNDALALQLDMRGKPGSASLMKRADSLRANEGAMQQADIMRSSPQPMAAGTSVPGTNAVTTTDIPPNEVAAFQRAAQGVAAGRQVVESPQPNDPVNMGGGALSSLAKSEFKSIAEQASNLQKQLDRMPKERITPAFITAIQNESNRLATQEGQLRNSRDLQTNLIANRPPARGTSAPSGYRFSEDGETLEPIPGGPKDSTNVKPLPTNALKLEQAERDAIGTAASISSDLKAMNSMIEDKKLDFGLISNLISRGRNLTGNSTEQSRNYNTAITTLERLRNDSLRLNKGVQTEGDSVRAWNELMGSLNDNDVVKQRLEEIKNINNRAIQLRKMNIDVIRQNYGHPPLDTSGYENVPTAIGGGAAAPATRISDDAEYNALPKGTRYIGPDGVTRTKP